MTTLAEDVKNYLTHQHADKSFSVLDLHHLAEAKGLYPNAVKHTIARMAEQGLVQRSSRMLNPRGGAPINLYRVVDLNKINKPRTGSNYQSIEQQRIQRMEEAGRVLAKALGVPCYA